MNIKLAAKSIALSVFETIFASFYHKSDKQCKRTTLKNPFILAQVPYLESGIQNGNIKNHTYGVQVSVLYALPPHLPV